MKYIITFLSIFLLLTNIAFAEQTTITPELLTRKDSKDYKKINCISKQLFTNIETSIDMSSYPTEYKNFPLMKETETQKKIYYYVQSNKAELVFDKETKKLKFISFKQPNITNAWIIYSYPTGKLSMVKIWRTPKEIYVFSSNGNRIDFTQYLRNLEKKIKSCFHVKNKLKFVNSQVEILFKIDKNGNLKSYKITKSSNIKEFDDNAIAAILKAAPFDQFPKGSQEEIEIMFTFKFQKKF